MLSAHTDLRKFAEKLVKVGREGVAWERRKLEWVLEQQRKKAEGEKSS